MPEIVDLPYAILGLVAAGGLGAALSTADGLLVTIVNALSHDLYDKMINPIAFNEKIVTISKPLLLWSQSSRHGSRHSNRGTFCSWSVRRSLWPRRVLPRPGPGGLLEARKQMGAIAAWSSGLAFCLYDMVCTYPKFIQWFGHVPRWICGRVSHLISAGVFGVPLGLITILE